MTSLAALTLEVAAVVDNHFASQPFLRVRPDTDEFSMGIHGIDSTLSDNDPDVPGIARNIYDDITFTHWSDSHGDWSYTDTLEFGDLVGRLEDALMIAGV